MGFPRYKLVETDGQCLDGWTKPAANIELTASAGSCSDPISRQKRSRSRRFH